MSKIREKSDLCSNIDFIYHWQKTRNYKNLEIELEIDKNLEIELEIYKNLENFEFYFKIFVNLEFYFEFFVISSFFVNGRWSQYKSRMCAIYQNMNLLLIKGVHYVGASKIM